MSEKLSTFTLRLPSFPVVLYEYLSTVHLSVLSFTENSTPAQVLFSLSRKTKSAQSIKALSFVLNCFTLPKSSSAKIVETLVSSSVVSSSIVSILKHLLSSTVSAMNQIKILSETICL